MPRRFSAKSSANCRGSEIVAAAASAIAGGNKIEPCVFLGPSIELNLAFVCFRRLL